MPPRTSPTLYPCFSWQVPRFPPWFRLIAQFDILGS
jgi:hypothetical protein